MVDVLIALFGGLYIGGRCLMEKCQGAENDRRFKEKQDTYQSRKDAWIKRVTDKRLEDQLEDQIYRMKNYNQIWEEVKEAYDEMPWKKEEDKFICLCPEDVEAVHGKGTFTKKQRENIAANHRKEVLRIMLAKRGKLKFYDAYYGIDCGGCGAPTAVMMREWNEESANFALWINEKLKKHGIQEELYIVFLSDNAYPLKNNKSKNGRYIWKPALNLYTKIGN